MHLKKLLPCFAILLLFNIGLASAQEDTSVADSIDSRINGMIQHSNTFKNYKVVRLTEIQALRNTVHTEVNKLQKALEQQQNQVRELQKKYEDQGQELAKTEENLEESRKHENEFSLLGLRIGKGYVIGIIVVLILALLGYIYQFKKANVVTAEAKSQLSDLQKEYDEYRKKAMDTQQKLGRQLVDARKGGKDRKDK